MAAKKQRAVILRLSEAQVSRVRKYAEKHGLGSNPAALWHAFERALAEDQGKAKPTTVRDALRAVGMDDFASVLERMK